MKKLTRFILAIILTISVVSVSSVFAEETTPDTTETVTDEVEQTPEEPTISLSEEATAFINNVNDAEANKDNILNAAQEYVDAYVASFDAEGEEATAEADALIVEKEEAFFNLFDQGALLDAYDALSEEEKNNEDVVNAKALLDALVLSVNTIMNTEEPSDEPTTYANGVTEGLLGGVPTQIDLITVDGDVYISDSGLYTGGTANRIYLTNVISMTYTGGSLVETFNPNGYEFSGIVMNKTVLIDPDITKNPTLIFNNINVTMTNGKPAFMTSLINDVTTTIIVNDGTTNTVLLRNGSSAGVEKNGENGTLVIKGETGTTSTGILNIDGRGGGLHTVALGAFPSNTSRITDGRSSFTNLTLDHVNLNVYAGDSHSAAIGTGCSGGVVTKDAEIRTYNIEILGGNVYAVGGAAGSAIGGGAGVATDKITIKDGAQVRVYGGNNSPAIGPGGEGVINIKEMSLTNLTISGGTTHVWAYGDQNSNVPGIGIGKLLDGTTSNIKLENVIASPEVPNWATYIKYGTSPTDYAFTTYADVNGAGESLATPINVNREFATFLQKKSEDGVNVFYTEVYFGLPHDELGSTDKADIGANNYGTCAGSFNWADTDAAKTALLGLVKVSGHDQDGILLNETAILANIYDNGTKQTAFEAQIQAIYDANDTNKTGNYPLTFTYNYTDTGDSQPREMSVTVYIQFRDACDPTTGGNSPVMAASNAVHPTGGAAFTKAELIGLTEGTASNYLGLDADLVNDITLTQADVDKINAAKTANQTGIFPLTYTYVTTTDGTTPTTLTKTVYVTLTDTGKTFTPKDATHPEKGQNMGPQIGANDYISKTGGAAFDTTTLKKIQNVSAKYSNGTSLPLDKLIPNPTQLAAINAAKVAGQIGDFPLKYTFEDLDGTIREVETTVKLRDNEGTAPTPVEKKDDRGNLIGYEISGYQTGSNNYTTPTGGAGWTDTEIKNLLDVVGDTAKGAKIDLTDFTVDATQLATLNAEKLAGKCGRYPITFIGPNNETVISYVTLNGCYVPPDPGKFLVTYLDCYGNTVKIEWVNYGGSSAAPNGNFSGVSNVTAHIEVKQNNCGVSTGYRVPNTAEK